MNSLQIDSEQMIELTSDKKRGKKKSQASTYQLAHVILIEAFKQEQTGREVVLSAVATEMHRNTKARAVNELVKLGLITVKRDGRQAVRVIKLK